MSTVAAGPRPRPLSRSESVEIARHQDRALLDMLRSLPPDAWDASTDCDPWTVRDIAAHILGWAEAFISPKEFTHQYIAGRRRAKELGNAVDGQNQVQVDERSGLPPDELVRRLEVALPKFSKLCGRFRTVGRAVPLYNPLFGPTNWNYLLNTIFPRDHFMHRIDIARATDADQALGASDARLLEDVTVDWTRRRKVQADLNLTGPAGGTYTLGDRVEASIEGDAIAFARILAGRGEPSEMNIEGDVVAVESWLRQGCPF